MTQVTDSNYKEIIASNSVCVFDFSASWCGPCKKLAPVVEALANEYEGKAFIGKVDVDETPEFTELVGIRNVPTVVFYKDGQLLPDRVIGASDKASLENKIKELL
ncbi:MAG: thiol reductase thioredoxin [Bacteroidales bacterium]|nr:MAG: thiol reductase thioredoxin [Bacteroidales bacterium]